MAGGLNYKNFIYMEDRGFIFAYVPKVACTNWKSLLRYMAGHEDWLDNRLAHDKAKGGLRYLDLAGSDAALLTDPGIRKYAMVRDPYSRTLSAYLNKVEQRLPPKPKGQGDHFDKVVRDVDAFRQTTLDTNIYPSITFEVFLLWLENSRSHFRNDEHWAPQTSLLRQPSVKFDFIGRFENLDTDSTRILKAMDCDQKFPSHKQVKFAPTRAINKMAQYYTKVTLALVVELFPEDFQNFSYPTSTKVD